MNRHDSNKSVYRPPSFWNKLSNFYHKADYVKPSIILFFFVFSVIFMYLFIKNPSKLAKSSYTHYFLLLLVLLGVGYYLYRNQSQIYSFGSLVSEHPFLFTLLTCTFITFFTIVYSLFSTTNSNTYYWSGQMLDIFAIILIVILGVFFFYHFISKANVSQRGWSGVVSEIIMYLPCKVKEIFVWFLGEMNNTPRKVFFLLLIEIALLVWIFYYQSTLKWFSIGQQVFPVYSGSVYLTNRTPITSYTNLSKDTGISNKTVPMNFGIAFWFHVNDNTQSLEKELPLFCYGGGEREVSRGCPSSNNPYANQNIHPAITFIPTHSQVSTQKSENLWQGAGLSWNIGHIKVYFSHCSPENENSMIIDVPLQRWNLLTLNYTSQKADVFLNGEVVASHTFTEPPVYSLGDSITVGGDELQGAIQDIQYSVLPFSKISVNAMYNNNLFINKVLPTFITR
jgi:hypothetical protein